MKLKKDYLYTGILIAIVLIAAFFYFNPYYKKQKEPEQKQPKDKAYWRVDANGYLYYPLDRESVKFTRANYTNEPNETVFVSKIVYESRNGYIYGLLVLPKSVSKQIPGIVLLPGVGVSKESELELAKAISRLGAAVLTIDQRGVGETDGNFPDLDEDYGSFVNAKEPVQHLMVYDALRAYDLLYSAPFVDHENIIIAGESLGGRIAVIAAAIDKNVKGVLIISSSGFGFTKGNDTSKDAFIKSIDSDHYIGQIAPRKLVMIHNIDDKIIPLSSAVRSYYLAQPPKKYFLVNDTSCNHGYCDSMFNGLVEGLNFILE